MMEGGGGVSAVLVLSWLLLLPYTAHGHVVYDKGAWQEDEGHERVRRSISPSEAQRIRDISPSDRKECTAGRAVPRNRVDTTARLAALRAEMEKLGIQGYIIPSEDAHYSEYTSEYDQRREFITGFSGSAGIAVVLLHKAALWTDGRYFLQADNQMDCNWILMKYLRRGLSDTPTREDWVKANLGAGQKIGASPWLMTASSWRAFSDNVAKQNITMVEVDPDLIDVIWTTNRTAQPNSIINPHDIIYTGRTWEDKINDMRNSMADMNANVMFITGLDETAWLFNLRAKDILYNPFFLSYAIVNAETNETILFIKDKDRKLTAVPEEETTSLKLFEHLKTSESGLCGVGVGACVQVKEYNNREMLSHMESVLNSTDQNKKVVVPYSCNHAIYKTIPEPRVLQIITPVARHKAKKNDVETHGLKQAHIRDAVALIKFAAKLEKGVQNGQYWTELSAAADLQKHRENQDLNRGLSFESISSSGSNGAIIHYAPTPETDKQITTTEMYLLDSGGQYLDGTTDVTRTFHFGTPTDFQRDCYTRVLIGTVDLANVNFTKGIYGRQIAVLARKPLWDVGLNYNHGTGHGIGSYLGVHEGPGFITMSQISFDRDNRLDENQFFSDEPGYYQENEFGIRHENIFMVKKQTALPPFPGVTWMGFETVTLVPYEPHLIKLELLNQNQINWLNMYHAKIKQIIGPLLADDPLATAWLNTRIIPLSKDSVVNGGPQISASITMFLSLLLSVLRF